MRCREQTGLKDTPANRKRAQKILDRIAFEISYGIFNYAATFPKSKMLRKLGAVAQKATQTEGQVPLFKDFAKTWFNESKVLWRPSTLASITFVLFNNIVPFFDELRVDEIKKEQIMAFRSLLFTKKGRSGDGLSADYINRHMQLIRTLMDEAAERYNFVSSYRGIKALKIPKSHVKPFTPDEINLLLQSCREDFKDYFLIRLFTGMRTGEIDGLKWKYVDFENRLILVRESFVRGEMTYTKNNSSQREIRMSQPVYDALIRMKAGTGEFQYVFVNRKGNPLDQCRVRDRIWYPLLKEAGLEKRNPYQTRHTAATLWLASGESPEWIANQMGHANTMMLFKVYSRYVPNLTRQDGSAADRMFANVMGEMKDA
jgi:integrase